MTALVIILRIIHIFSGIFWVGFAIFNFVYFQPALKATGAEGQSVLQYLSKKTSLMPTVYLSATLTFISGLALFWPMSATPAVMHSGYGMIISIGALAGIVAWVMAVFVIRGILKNLEQAGQAMQSQDGAPSKDQIDKMTRLSKRLNRNGRIALIFMMIAVLGMSIAQYAWF
ncbi:MAG: hypothetical protein K9N35_02380 [Candidatus Marinimicrobia bacterium]|nr:hypothetical protein [Candidatus Neomarinimicrobiota bacterium]